MQLITVDMIARSYGGLSSDYLGGGKKKTTINELHGSTDDKDVANILNNYFTDIMPELSSQMPDSLLNIDYSFNDNREQFDLMETTADEVMKLILYISSNKSTGVDGVPIRGYRYVQ